ncbi:MAG: hypothetical protein HXY50_15010 [Ignavibacteriaceae bacterium]|nr:hypothetical protein [Ignavibacteriaceae bacterium]
MNNLLFAFFVCVVFSIQLYSQGKIISKQEADDLFGTVLISKEIPTSTLFLLTESSAEIIMFKILGNDVYILGKNRKVLLPTGGTVNETDTFSVYSTNLFRELLLKGNMPSAFVEQRNEVLTITCGNYTLEFAILCPPICF